MCEEIARSILQARDDIGVETETEWGVLSGAES